MVLILLTGGNGDVGVECCKQLATKPEVTKVVITCRSKKKAAQTIDAVVAATGKDRSFFGFALIDFLDYSSIVEGVKSCPDKIDRLCLNVGALGKCKMHPCGATDAVTINALCHALFFERLMEAGKLQKGSRIIYVGSEVSHDIYSFSGLLPHYYGNFSKKHIEWAISKNFNDPLGRVMPVRRQLGDYKNSKIIAQLYFAALAKEYPEMHFMTISPGAIEGEDGKGTGFTQEGFFPLNVMMKKAPKLLHYLGVSHTIVPAVERYMDGVLLGEQSKYKSGAMVMSSKDGFGKGLFFWGAKGDYSDIRSEVKYLADEDLAAETAIAVRKYLNKWRETSKLEKGKVSIARYSLSQGGYIYNPSSSL